MGRRIWLAGPLSPLWQGESRPAPCVITGLGPVTHDFLCETRQSRGPGSRPIRHQDKRNGERNWPGGTLSHARSPSMTDNPQPIRANNSPPIAYPNVYRAKPGNDTGE
jgi:hypothetical protein